MDNSQEVEVVEEEKPKTLIELLDDIEESSRFGQQADAVYRGMKSVVTAKDALLYSGSIAELDFVAPRLARSVSSPPSINSNYDIQMVLANAPSVAQNIDYI